MRLKKLMVSKVVVTRKAQKQLCSVFYDENAILFDDPDHSDDEERFILMGISENEKLCLVCHCYRESDKVIRIISARKATKKESIEYLEIQRGW